MKSTKCKSCSLVQWADNQNCKRCGTPLGFNPTSHQAAPTEHANYQSPNVAPSGEWSSQRPSYGYQPGPYGTPGGPQLKTGLALASMIIAIIAFPMTFLLFGVLLAPVAVILGIVALRKASKQPHVYGGNGFAIAGIAVGSVVCVFILPLIAAIAIPNLLAARRAANEGSAMSTIRTIAMAQATYSSTAADSSCGDLKELALQNLIPGELASGRKSGYKFEAKGSLDDEYGCEVTAIPQSKSHGTRSFYYSSEDQLMRVTHDGTVADHSDLPIESSRASN